MKLKQKPLTLVCYLCGRQFGTLSLKIHLKTCKDKFEIHQNKQPQHSRIKLPEQPPLLLQILQGRFESAKEYNDYALNFHKYHVLPACAYCHRTFNEDSLQVHQKVCPKKPKQMISQETTEIKNQIVKMPRTLVCCVCGRQFGVSSLKIHYPQCLQKFRIEEEKKAKDYRRTAAVFDAFQLQQVNYKQNWSNEQIKQFNEKAMKKFESSTKMFCKGCNRRFMPQGYKHHLENCQLHNKPVQKGNSEAKTIKEIKMPKVMVCHICGMQFGVSSVLIHQKACKLKFINNEKLKPIGERRSLPQISNSDYEYFNLKDATEWNQEKITQYNKIASEVYQKQVMRKCKFCSRTFRQQAFEKHFNYCSNQQKKRQQKKQLQEKVRDFQLSKQKFGHKLLSERKNSCQEHKNKYKDQVLTLKNDKILEMKQDENAKKIQQMRPKQEVKLSSVIDFELVKDTNETNFIPEQNNKQQALITFNKNSHHKINPKINILQTLKVIEEIQNESLTEASLHRSNPLKQQKLKVIQNQVSQNITIKNSQTKATEQGYSQKSPDTIKSHQKIDSNEEAVYIQLISCKKCGRKFLPQRILKHQSICKGIQKFNIITKNPSDKKITPSKEWKQMNICQFQKGIEKDHKKQKEIIHNKSLKQIKKDTQVKYPQQPYKVNKVERIDQNLDVNNKNIQKIYDQQHSFKLETKQFDEDAIFQSIKCKTCNRNFRLDRIEVHERICQNTKQNCIKMKPSLPKKKENDMKNIQKTQSLDKRTNSLHSRSQSKQRDELFKTKYTEMLKQIKSRRVKESDIDHQLDVQLNQFSQQKVSTKQNSWNFKTNKVDDKNFETVDIVKIQQDNIIHQSTVGKWKKRKRSGYLKQP